MSTPLRHAAVSLRTTSRGAPAGFLKHAAATAEYFGFRRAHELDPRERSHNFAKVAAAAAAKTLPGEPVLAHYASASPTHLPAQLRALIKHGEVGEFGMVIAGPEESLAEAMLIRATATIVSEWGAPAPRVRLNVMGDRDSKTRFSRELGAYLRKHFDTLDDTCRRATADDPAAAYQCHNGTCREVLAGGPRAMNFLSEKSRAHFRELLEHVEQLAIPYELDDLLMGDERESRVSFAIDTPAEGMLLGAIGGRYDDHTKKQGGKPLCAASIYFRKGGLGAAGFNQARKGTTPKVYFIQLGVRAKIQGLGVVDILRRAQVPMLQSFDARSLGPQLLAARAAGTPHIIIMGAREALDGTVIIRALDNSTQQIVPVKDLPRVLRFLR